MAAEGPTGEIRIDAPARAAFELLPDPVLLLDGELVIRYASARVRPVFGWAPEDLSGRPLTELVASEDAATVRALAAPHPAGGAHPILVVSVRLGDGASARMAISAVDRRSDPAIRAIVLTVRNVTDVIPALAEVERARDSYLTLLDRFPTPVWRSTTRLGVDWVNRTYLAFTGRAVEQELGEGWAELVHPDDLPDLLEVLERTFEDREPFVLQYRLRHRSGEYRWVVDHGEPIFGLEGEFLGQIGAFFDIHDRRRTEEVLRATVEELRGDLGALARVADEHREQIARLLEDEDRRARGLADQIENDQLQALAALKLRIELLGEQLREDPVASGMDPIMRSVEETMRRMRRLMRELREQDVEDPAVD